MMAASGSLFIALLFVPALMAKADEIGIIYTTVATCPGCGLAPSAPEPVILKVGYSIHLAGQNLTSFKQIDTLQGYCTTGNLNIPGVDEFQEGQTSGFRSRLELRECFIEDLQDIYGKF